MNLRKLKKHFRPGTVVTRDRMLRVTQVSASGLNYKFDERKFENESALTEYAKSKLPVAHLSPES